MSDAVGPLVDTKYGPLDFGKSVSWAAARQGAESFEYGYEVGFHAAVQDCMDRLRRCLGVWTTAEKEQWPSAADHVVVADQPSPKADHETVTP